MAELSAWLTETFGVEPRDLPRYERALTHGSQASANYERLEFLGDRVLGLAMAEWLFELFADEAEGALSKRLNALVTGAVCAEVARAIGLAGSAALAALVLVAGLLILFDFPLSPVAGPPFAPEAARIAAAPAGERLVVPISPPGWEMELNK